MAHGPQKNPLDFGDNPEHVTLGWGRLGLWLGGAETYHRTVGMFYRHLFHSNNSAGSVALAVVSVMHCTERNFNSQYAAIDRLYPESLPL